VQDFRELRVWERSHALTLEVYRATQSWPPEERYGLTAQIRRSVASIATNIAEGSVRPTDLDFARFLHIALGSASELDYQLLLARDLGYLDEPTFRILCEQTSSVRRMLNRFIQSLKSLPANS
jgi:four helix bundle protein